MQEHHLTSCRIATWLLCTVLGLSRCFTSVTWLLCKIAMWLLCRIDKRYLYRSAHWLVCRTATWPLRRYAMWSICRIFMWLRYERFHMISMRNIAARHLQYAGLLLWVLFENRMWPLRGIFTWKVLCDPLCAGLPRDLYEVLPGELCAGFSSEHCLQDCYVTSTVCRTMWPLCRISCCEASMQDGHVTVRQDCRATTMQDFCVTSMKDYFVISTVCRIITTRPLWRITMWPLCWIFTCWIPSNLYSIRITTWPLWKIATRLSRIFTSTLCTGLPRYLLVCT